MAKTAITSANPLNRIDLVESPRALLNRVLKEYGLGDLRSCKVLQKGIVEINIKVDTSKGSYVVKIYSNKRLPRVGDILKGLQAFRRNGIPVSKLYVSKKGKNYFVVKSKSGKTHYGCVIGWFAGEDFTGRPASENELKVMAKYVAMIHKTKLDIKKTYDDCFPINLPREYERYKAAIMPTIQKHIQTVIKKLNNINKTKLQSGTIHGDLAWEHFLSDEKGNLCILDLGGLNIGQIVVDLAYFMSYFCIDPLAPFKSKIKKRYLIMLGEYLKHNSLSDYEVENLPLFIQASLANDYVVSAYYKDIFRDRVWFTPEKFVKLSGFIEEL